MLPNMALMKGQEGLTHSEPLKNGHIIYIEGIIVYSNSQWQSQSCHVLVNNFFFLLEGWWWGGGG